MRTLFLSILLLQLLTACTSGQSGEPAPSMPTPRISDALTPEHLPDTITAVASGTDIQRANAEPDQDRTPLRLAAEDEGCAEHIGYHDNAGHITIYISRKLLVSSRAEILEMLPGTYSMAEQSAPRSIADDFENGISTEHIHMPDTLPVIIRIFEKCSAREPYAVQHHRVWRDGHGGWGMDEK